MRFGFGVPAGRRRASRGEGIWPAGASHWHASHGGCCLNASIHRFRLSVVLCLLRVVALLRRRMLRRLAPRLGLAVAAAGACAAALQRRRRRGAAGRLLCRLECCAVPGSIFGEEGHQSAANEHLRAWRRRRWTVGWCCVEDGGIQAGRLAGAARHRAAPAAIPLLRCACRRAPAHLHQLADDGRDGHQALQRHVIRNLREGA